MGPVESRRRHRQVKCPSLPWPTTTETKMAITSQPRSWKYELFGCMEDKGVCCKAVFCTCCMACDVIKDMGESPCGILCCVNNWLNVMRTKYRTQQNIDGDICNDCLMSSFCGLCLLCQLKRDVDATKADGTLNNIAVR